MQTSSVGSLKDKLRKNLETDRLQTEQLMKDQLSELTASLNRSVSDELNTIGAGIQAQSRAINEQMTELSNNLQLLKKQRIKPYHMMFLAPIVILLIICGVNWGLVQYWRNNLDTLKTEISEAETTLVKLAKDGGKIRLNHCTDNQGQRHLCVKIDRAAGEFGSKGELWMIPEGY